ncbi:MAG: DUF1446 domain-containing protein [Pirellulaceae bacterium]|nr:DUF1446 domain-containing protein [Pirellulaceae bacterium]
MPSMIRIGNAHGFWGDRIEAAAEMLQADPDLDYITLDFLAEVSLSIMASQRQHDASLGYATDFIDVVRTLVPYWRSGGKCRLVTNAGGLNPLGCARVCQEILQAAGCDGRRIGVVSGDDVLSLLTNDTDSRSLDTLQSYDHVADRLMTANAYLGAEPIVEALSRGSDLVITGRVADPSLTVGPCMHDFQWSPSDYQRIAGATVAGHLIECGRQVTGGIATDWLSLPDAGGIGFPIVEVREDGSCVVTKSTGSGGQVTESTVKEQLIYEIGDPDVYLSPDATVSFLSLNVQQQSHDRVAVSGAKGQSPSETYKVSATYAAGFRAAGQLTIYGVDAQAKATRAAELVFETLKRDGATFQNQLVELLGTGACVVGTDRSDLGSAKEVILRIAVSDSDRRSVVKFTRAMMPLITGGPPGTTGYAEGRPKVHPLIGYWPCLIRRDRVRWTVQILSIEGDLDRPSLEDSDSTQTTAPGGTQCGSSPREVLSSNSLNDIAHARSGDKGIHANIGVIARESKQFDLLKSHVTRERVAEHLDVDVDAVLVYPMQNLAAINFVILGILENPLRTDAQGKTLGQQLLQLPLRHSI